MFWFLVYDSWYMILDVWFLIILSVTGSLVQSHVLFISFHGYCVFLWSQCTVLLSRIMYYLSTLSKTPGNKRWFLFYLWFLPYSICLFLIVLCQTTCLFHEFHIFATLAAFPLVPVKIFSKWKFFFVFRARAATNIWMRVHFHLFPSISSSVLCFEKCFDYIHVYLYLQMCQLHQRQYFSAPATVLLVFFIFLLSFPSTHKACLSTT